MYILRCIEFLSRLSELVGAGRLLGDRPGDRCSRALQWLAGYLGLALVFVRLVHSV